MRPWTHSVRWEKRGRFLVPFVVTGWAVLSLGMFSAGARAEDWPTYQHDAARSGVTAEPVKPPLAPCWVFRPLDKPQPAWGDPKPEPVEDILELRRAHFDDVFHVAVADGAVFFGSSANGKVYCLDAATGKIRWTAPTDGPVRLAPMVVDGRVYVGSDDGRVYCLDAKDGSVVWKLRASPEDRWVLGSGKMISLYPVRTGVLVDGGTAYFAGGIFPTEGVFLHAADARDGKSLWQQDSFCEHARENLSVSPQGYLLASASTLYAPMGRVSPAAFDRRDGRMKYVNFFGKTVGGTYALLAGKHVYTGTEEMLAYDQETCDRFAKFAGRKMIVAPETAYLATDDHVIALDRQSKGAAAQRWKTACPCHDALILADGVLFAGGADQVAAVDAASGKVLWSAKVEGKAKGLAAAAGRLLVSTDTGMIYSFGPEGSPQHGDVTEPVNDNPYAGSPTDATFKAAAEAIVRETGVRRGFCLVLGCETGQLALELAKRTDLTIYAVSPDAEKVAAAKKALDAAGVYGSRVSVHEWPLDAVGYSDYFANLIVSETAMLTGGLPPAGEALRMLKPVGGTLMVGQPAEPPSGAKPLSAERLQAWLAEGKLDGGRTLDKDGRWAVFTRGPLPGAGSWTHQYADAGNTACGDDTIIKAPLGVLWFGQPGPSRMVNRHLRSVSPLSMDGRLFVQGENVIMAHDAYNGMELWQRELPGASLPSPRNMHRGSNLALGPAGLFVAVGEHCLRLDPATGKTLSTYALPPSPDGVDYRWGYMACVGDTLYGSHTANSFDSNTLFALDVGTGKPRWVYQGSKMPHNTIAISNGRLFAVSNTANDEERNEVIAQQRERIKELPEYMRPGAEKVLAQADVRTVVALDANTGEVAWQRPADLSRKPGKSVSGSEDQAAMVHDGVLVLFGVYLDGHHWKEFFAGEFDSRRITALDAADGKLLWEKRIGFRVRPVIVGDTLHAEPWAFDLRTGEQKTRVNPVTGRQEAWQFARPGHHCGCPCAAPNALFFRSWYLGYYDLEGDYGTEHFAGQRPGCWINFVPAGGLLLVPEASAGCLCAFPTVCSIAYQPIEKEKAWAMYSTPGPMTPVRRLALNLGVPGDRKDAAGNLWLGYPRPTGSLVLKFDLDAAFYPGGRFVQENSNFTDVAGTDDPWLFASAADGLRKLVVPLLGRADGSAAYRVRLAFAAPEGEGPGQRVFDILLQGKPVAADYDIVREAGGANRAVLAEFDGVVVDGDLVIELVTKQPNPTSETWPRLAGVEIVRQQVLSLGCALSDFVLSTADATQPGSVELVNLRDTPFSGKLALVAPDGFEVSPKSIDVKLAPGSRETIPIRAAVVGDVAAGNYAIAAELLRDDGTVELKRAAQIEHLGRRNRVVVRATEDSHVIRRYADRNHATAGSVLLDGGDKKAGDEAHAQVCLKFPIDVPGTVRSVRLRLTNAGNPTRDSGRVRLAEGPWSENTLTYANCPKPGQELAKIGAVAENQVVEIPLRVDLAGKQELCLMLDSTDCDGVDYLTREGGKPAELIIEYEPK